jgi:hypothetical protein
MRLRTPAFLSLFCAIAGATAFACSAPSDSAGASSGTDESNVNSDSDIFAKPEAMAVKISAPFSTLFTRLKANQADPPDADAEAGAVQETQYSEPGQLVFTQEGAEKKLDMRVYVRGESSRGDCPFPKLKIEFSDKEQLKKTPFKGHSKMRLNTHCGPGDASARSGMGRVMNGVGPVREELTYRLIRAMGIPTYRTRVIQVHYDDRADQTQTDSFGMLMEVGDDAAQRFQKMDPPLIPKEWEYLDPNQAWNGRITPENTAQIATAEAFSGNKDWGGTHNIDSFGIAQAPTMFQIAQDFDLGAIVLGDIARYWKGSAPVTDAQPSLREPATAKLLHANKAAVTAAYLEAEKAAIASKAIASADGTTTTDPGFLEAKKRIAQLYDLPELQNVQQAPAADGGAADAAPDAH